MKVGIDVSTETPRCSPVVMIGTNPSVGLGRFLCLRQRALGSRGCALAELTAEATDGSLTRWKVWAGLSGTAELPPGEGADQQRTSEDGGRLRPDTTAGWRRRCGPRPYRTDGLGESVLFAGGVRTTCGCVAAGGGGVMSWAGSVGAVVSWKRT